MSGDPLVNALKENISLGSLTRRVGRFNDAWYERMAGELRAALASETTDAGLPVGAVLASALMAANYGGDSGEDVDRLIAELAKRGYALAPIASETTDAGLREVERALRNAYGDVADVWPHFAAIRAPLASETTDAGLLLKLLAESDIATTTYNDLRRVLVAVCAAYDRTVAKP